MTHEISIDREKEMYFAWFMVNVGGLDKQQQKTKAGVTEL